MLSKTTVHHYGGSKFLSNICVAHAEHLKLALCYMVLDMTTTLWQTALDLQKHCYSMNCMFADNVDLGTACGKLHRVCTLAITDPGMNVPLFT